MLNTNRPLCIICYMVYRLYTDGGARGNPGPAGLGVILKDGNGNTVVEVSSYLGRATNNEAEYKALLLGLKTAVEKDVEDISCYLDSLLVVNQLNGLYKVKNAKLKKLFDEALLLRFKFKSVKFEHVSRDKNKRADELVNMVLDKQLSKK